MVNTKHVMLCSVFSTPLMVSVFVPAFFIRKKGYINFVSKSVRRPSVRLSVRPCVRPSVTFLVNVSPPKTFEVATSSFVVELVTRCRGYWAAFRVTLKGQILYFLVIVSPPKRLDLATSNFVAE